MLKQQAIWDAKYGADTWVTGYEINGVFLPREEALKEIYFRSYYAFLDAHPEMVRSLSSYSGVYNPHALLSDSTDIQAFCVESYMSDRGWSFGGQSLLPIGAYQPKKMTNRLKSKIESLGLSFNAKGKVVYPSLSYELSPFKVPCVLNSEMSIETFWQSDHKCLALPVSSYIPMVGDMFEVAPDGAVLCVTTNGIRNKNGDAVMGKGIAKVASTTLLPVNQETLIQEKLGHYLSRYGNRTFRLGLYRHVTSGKTFTLVSFPTKHHWRDPSDLALIEKSCEELLEMCSKFGWNEIYLPVPGSENGQLKWDSIRSVVSVLDSRFRLITKDHKLFG